MSDTTLTTADKFEPLKTVIYTLIENVRREGYDPHAYLQWVFEKIPVTHQFEIV
ncbi:transposase domain-containing protein [Rubritalea halochordaticola]|uniref:transposase domain-containing protein n=1 Tax=Rubritalea halochordaticola TaxID=714537 RepID=UPI0031FCAD2F